MEELLAALHHEQQQAARHRGDAVRNATTLRWNSYTGMTTHVPNRGAMPSSTWGHSVMIRSSALHMKPRNVSWKSSWRRCTMSSSRPLVTAAMR